MYGGVVARLSGKHGRVLLAFPRHGGMLLMLVATLSLSLVFGWFFATAILSWPVTFVTGYVGVVALLIVVFLGPQVYVGGGALHERGVVAPDSFTPWADVVGYTTWEPNGLSLSVRRDTLMMPEGTVELLCPAEMRKRAVGIIEERAPGARRMGGGVLPVR